MHKENRYINKKHKYKTSQKKLVIKRMFVWLIKKVKKFEYNCAFLKQDRTRYIPTSPLFGDFTILMVHYTSNQWLPGFGLCKGKVFKQKCDLMFIQAYRIHNWRYYNIICIRKTVTLIRSTNIKQAKRNWLLKECLSGWLKR